MKRALLLAVLLLTSTAPRADEAYRPEDADLLQACVDDVTESLANDDPDDDGSFADCIGMATNACQEEPGNSSTLGIVACNNREEAWWDAQLNQSYGQLRDTLDADTFALLQAAQRAWIAFRDADCRFVDAVWKDGTIHSIMSSGCMLEKTAQRAIDLRQAQPQD